MTMTMPLLDRAIAMAQVELPDGLEWGLRTLQSSRGYRWPRAGEWATCENPSPGGACPTRVGDGLCVATTWRGMGSGGHSAAGGLILAGWRAGEVLGGDDTKVRVPRAFVGGVFTLTDLITGANLAGADLAGAYLAGANLTGADLAGADLAGAILAGAILAGADLAGADLAGADLAGANLAGANLAGADLAGANLAGAYLAGANLTGADLARAIGYKKEAPVG